MALNLDAMKAKLDKLNGKGDGAKKNFWRPEDGESNIRIVSTPDGDPFKEKFFHYGVGGQSFLCPKRNFGDDCPTCNFANKLWNEGTEDSKRQAKELFAKQRFFSPVLVRGEESEGIRVWGYGKMAYEKLLTIVLDPDYGDITDPESGNDLKLMYGKLPGASFHVLIFDHDLERRLSATMQSGVTTDAQSCWKQFQTLMKFSKEKQQKRFSRLWINSLRENLEIQMWRSLDRIIQKLTLLKTLSTNC